MIGPRVPFVLLIVVTLSLLIPACQSNTRQLPYNGTYGFRVILENNPAAVDPTWAQVVAWFSPLAHATTLSRNLFLGCLDLSMVWDTLWLLVAAAAPILPAIAVLRHRLVK